MSNIDWLQTPHILEAQEKPVRDLPSPMHDVVKEGYLHLKKFITDGKVCAADMSKKFEGDLMKFL